MKKSIYLVRTNPALTTNVKLVCDTSYNLYLESYSSNLELSDNKYKKVLISSDSFISERISTFYKDLPSSLAFEVRQNSKSDTITNNLNDQIDDIYFSGMRMVEDTRYIEEFEYTTTLKIDPNNLPKYFFIFREDGPGIDSTLTPVVSPDFNNFKCIQSYDLSKQTNLGKLFQKNYVDDDIIPRSPFELNLKKFEFSKWNGYDYKTGGTTSKSLFLDDYFRNQTTHFELEKFITEGFQKNEIISSNYLNVSYLFDDTVSGVLAPNINYDLTKDYKFLNEDVYNGDFDKTTELTISNTGTLQVNDFKSFRKRWTINRYYGFYFDEFNLIKKVSPYNPANFIMDGTVSIYKNQFIVTGTSLTLPVNINPVNEVWNTNKVYHIKIKDTFYLIEQNNNEYNIISDIIFGDTVEILISDLIRDYDPIVKIIWNSTDNVSELVYLDNTPFVFNYDTYTKYANTTFQILLIKIFDKYYTVNYGNGATRLVTDWYITCDGNKFVRKYDSNKTETIFTQILSKDYSVPYFEFYSTVFTRVADFDFSRTDTGYANIENNSYEKVNLNRPFLLETDIKDTGIPKDHLFEQNYQIKIFKSDDLTYTPIYYPTNLGDIFTVPSTSEYAVCGDLYMLDSKRNLTAIWNQNQSINKWGINNSINYCGYAYKLNNNLDFSGIHNFTPNPYSEETSSNEFSLDWFYTPGLPCEKDLNYMNTVATFVYKPILNLEFQSLNIYTNNLFNVNGRKFSDFEKFDLIYYKNVNAKYDIFSRFFNLPNLLSRRSTDSPDYTVARRPNDPVNRLAKFNRSDIINGPMVFFKGILASAEYTITDNPNDPKNIEYLPANDLEDYNFSILFDNKETTDITKYGNAGIELIINKKFKNILIYMYIYTPLNAITSLHHRMRDDVYNDKDRFVSYTYFNGTSFIEVNSSLSIESLKLHNLYTILNKQLLITPDFNDGITYSIIDDIKKYTIVSNLTPVINSDINGYNVEITFDTYIDFKHGDWVYCNFGISIPTKNYKINKIVNKNTVVIELDNLLISPILTTNFYITKEVSKLPFRLRCILPEIIDIDKNVNIIDSDNLTNIIPDNKLSTINNVINYDIASTISANIIGNIDYVWNNQPLSRQLIKNTNSKDLTYKEVEALPKILRYSADYEPILKDINIFNHTRLLQYGYENLGDTNSDGLYVKTFYIKLINGKNKLFIEYYNNSSINNIDINSDNGPFNVNDIIYIKTSGTYLATYPQIHNKITHIDNITSYIDPGTSPAGLVLGLGIVKVFVIETNLEFDTLISPTYDQYALSTLVERYAIISAFTFKEIKAFTFNNEDQRNYGLIKDVIISKWTNDTQSPLKSSNKLYNDKNRYPLSDEHGMTTVDINIWKSSWDYEYYYKIQNNKYK